MKDPGKQLRDYLEKLIHRFLYIKSLDRQLKLINEWETPNRAEALNIGSYFFRLVIYSFNRTILIELCKLVSDKEEKSLVDWMKKAKEHTATIKPTRYNPDYSEAEREPIKPKEYRTIIDSQEDQLDAQKTVIDRVKAQRDRALTHSDSAYFNNPQELYKHYPLSTNDIDDLMDTVSEILRQQHLFLLGGDILEMEVKSVHNVDIILRYVRGFSRARKDKELIKKGFKPFLYTHDDQEREF